MKVFALILLVVALSLAVAVPVSAHPDGGGRAGTESGPIYVTNQDLLYDVITPVHPGENGVPWKYENQKRPWQLLIRPGDLGYDNSGPAGIPQTMYGPGDPGYKGGRWWIDDNQNGYQDADDIFFLCPLLGPGREAP